ncbi:MAG: hypothetical protein OEV59_09005 [Deltaproteobacteria bacterium]|nr:hypothetical protein [Deltaproteobacteria bacterium]
MAKNRFVTLKKTVIALIAAAITSGCAGSKTAQAPLLAHFVLVPIELNVEGFNASGNAASFENKRIRLSAKSVLPNDRQLEKKAFAALNSLFFMFVEFEITNKSSKPFIYKPNYTHLRTQIGNYIRPSDYTAIYDILSKLYSEESPTPAMSEIRGLYFDSDITIPPGASVKRLLVFERLSKEALGMEAGLTIDELYIGTDAVDMALPFKVKLYQEK